MPFRHELIVQITPYQKKTNATKHKRTLVKHFPKLITHQCKSFQQSSLGNWRKRTDCINPLLGAAQNSSKVSSLATFAQVLLVVFSIFHLQHCLYGQVLFALPVSRCCCLAPADPHSDARHILRGCRKILVNLFFTFLPASSDVRLQKTKSPPFVVRTIE